MAKHPEKLDFPVSHIRRYLEPGPIVMVSSALGDRYNIMTMGWYTVMEFTPSLVGCVIADGNHSFDLIRNSRECVINLPTTSLTDVVVGIGNTTGAEIDKFERFGLTAQRAMRVKAPLIPECHASFECRILTWPLAAIFDLLSRPQKACQAARNRTPIVRVRLADFMSFDALERAAVKANSLERAKCFDARPRKTIRSPRLFQRDPGGRMIARVWLAPYVSVDAR